MEKYTTLKESHSLDFQQIQKKFSLVSSIRLGIALLFLLSLYAYFQTGIGYILLLTAITLGVFIRLMKIHSDLSWKRNIKQQLIIINEEEISYLKGEELPFYDGVIFQDTTHAYSYDLDFFGAKSLYQNLNRTATYKGQEMLATLLKSLLSPAQILENQIAIKELSAKVEWRQDVLALGKSSHDDKKNYEILINWAKEGAAKLPNFTRIYAKFVPFVFWGLVAVDIFTSDTRLISLTMLLFLVNLLVMVLNLAYIRRELMHSDKIHKIIRQYSLIIEKLEKETFDSTKLRSLQAQLNHHSTNASVQMSELSSLISGIESIQNVMWAVLASGSSLYHLRTLQQLIEWKNQYAQHIPTYLDIMGEFETLNSLANFSFNNSAFVFPNLNDKKEIAFTDLGHPLIKAEKRVCNSLDFNNQRFIILTGSNMSGKSTFLRTLGINMVLAGIGASICATTANVHPLNVLVSMRLSDSLTDSESYFFAEVKRLKEIMDIMEEKTCFVLLDEILRGTNSDDKQTGTIEVIKKIIAKGGIGAIATHDLEVCLTTHEFPDILTNKCFEVEIIDNELCFDYKLRNDICKNKSATFLMKKMGIIGNS